MSTQGGAAMSGSQGMGSSTTMQRGGTGANASMQGGGQYNVNQAQGQRRGGMRGMDAAERQVTECLNNAAAQRSSFDACKR